MKNFTITALALVFCATANAQGTIVTYDAPISPRFFVAIVAGVLLALALQFVLTALSVALGITMNPSQKKRPKPCPKPRALPQKAVRPKQRPPKPKESLPYQIARKRSLMLGLALLNFQSIIK